MTRAREALQEARLLEVTGHSRAAVSRAYYAAFYAARAAVQEAGSDAGTHRGVASEFSRLVVQTGRISIADARLLRSLLASRLEADYDDGDSLTPQAVSNLIRSAERFVEMVERPDAPPPHVPDISAMTPDQKRDLIAQLTREMEQASMNLEFERAAEFRDSVAQIEADLAA